jgi:mannose-1-phosphate guanylyltransferase
MAREEQLQSMLLSGYWTKLVDKQSYMAGTAAHLEIMRFMKPASLTASAAGYSIKGDVMVHESATIGDGCVLGPRVVVGPGCNVAAGVRLEDTTLLAGVRVAANSLIKGSLIGWKSSIGRWCFVTECTFGEETCVADGLLVNCATVLPQKELTATIRTAQIVI